MHKRVLLADGSDTIRNVAGNVLRQNGFEVISVSEAEKAMEVLNFSRPDLLIINANLRDQGQRPLYERIRDDSRFTSIPFLLLAEPGSGDLPFPEEVVITMPFDPREFVERAMLFTGRSVSPEQPAAVDSAPGHDRIEVTDSEVMDKTSAGFRVPGKTTEKMIGFDHEKENTDIAESSKVESIMIRDDQTDIVQKQTQKEPLPLSSTGKLDILKDSDQYAVNSPHSLERDGEHQPDDYEWFLSEMRKEAKAPSQPGAKSQATPDSQQSKLSIAEPSSLVDPITPGPAGEGSPGAQVSGDGVEKFIGEFKKEVERLQDQEPESIVLRADKEPEPHSTSATGWEDSLEKITPEQVKLFTREFTATLAEKIAAMIVERIDGDKLVALIRDEIRVQASRKR
ncbi:MAG: hypothetical protein KAU35_00135 [candidate division Zixibacteria bacterium]|nr:hypothetical protein [candidate division Zixibacteria bacterium]